jgi:hypothetical protein
VADPDTITNEIYARYWAETGRKPGQRLDPHNPTDHAYLPVWQDIARKVQHAAVTGTLITTFKHPVVAQSLADAAIAHKAAAAHLDMAAVAPDAATAQDNIAAATAAAQISLQKAHEAAAFQRRLLGASRGVGVGADPVVHPTISLDLVQEAGKQAVKTPPPPSAPSAEHLAHEHARKHAQGQPKLAQAPSSPAGLSHEDLYKEVDARFGQKTHGYKQGQPLDMSIAQDREMAKIWRALLQQVQHEIATNTRARSWSVPSPTMRWSCRRDWCPPHRHRSLRSHLHRFRRLLR